VLDSGPMVLAIATQPNGPTDIEGLWHIEDDAPRGEISDLAIDLA